MSQGFPKARPRAQTSSILSVWVATPTYLHLRPLIRMGLLAWGAPWWWCCRGAPSLCSSWPVPGRLLRTPGAMRMTLQKSEEDLEGQERGTHCGKQQSTNGSHTASRISGSED